MPGHGCLTVFSPAHTPCHPPPPPPLSVVAGKLKPTEKEARILVLGLDNAGKTTILKKMADEDITQCVFVCGCLCGVWLLRVGGGFRCGLAAAIVCGLAFPTTWLADRAGAPIPITVFVSSAHRRPGPLRFGWPWAAVCGLSASLFLPTAAFCSFVRVATSHCSFSPNPTPTIPCSPPCRSIMPTQGFNIKTLVHDGFKLNVWDVGGA